MKKSNKKVGKKEVLNEQMIRRFMKLSAIGPLTPGFIKRLSEHSACGMEEEEGLMEEDPMEDELPPEVGGEDEMPEEEVPIEGGDEGMVQNLVTAIADAIQGVSGVEVTVSGGEGGEAEMPADVGSPVSDEEIPPMPPKGEESQEEEEEEEDKIGEGKEEVVEEKGNVKKEVKELKPIKMDKVTSSAGAANTGKLKPLSEAMILKVAKLVANRLLKETKKSKK
jgi:hypothetical protein